MVILHEEYKLLILNLIAQNISPLLFRGNLNQLSIKGDQLLAHDQSERFVRHRQAAETADLLVQVVLEVFYLSHEDWNKKQ